MKLRSTGIGALIAAGLFVACGASEATVERADLGEQGPSEAVFAADGISLTRMREGLQVRVEAPRPAPGTYEYPTGDMVPEGVAPHPDISVGGPDDPEVFTLWMFIFNNPEECTDGACDFDDIGDTPAKGGIYQVDGRIAVDATLELGGGVRLGQLGGVGSVLDNPLGAEVHIGIAPHGRALEGDDLVRQLNGTVGSQAHWWSGSFIP